MDPSKLFGNKSSFAISYRPTDDSVDSSSQYAFCNLIIKDRLIGSSDEVCYLPTWVYYLTDARNFIQQNKNKLFPIEFHDLNDPEIYEFILNSKDQSIRYNHTIILDETIDGYYFYYYVKDNKISFLIEDLHGLGYETKRSYNFIFATEELDLFLDTIRIMVDFLVETYPYLINNISKRHLTAANTK